MKLIETIELSTSSSSVTFTDIPQDGDILCLAVTTRGDNSASLRFNGNSTSIYNAMRINGTAIDRTITRFLNGTAWLSGLTGSTGSNASNFSGNMVIIGRYKLSTWSGGLARFITFQTAGLTTQQSTFRDTTPITSIEVFLFSGNFSAGSVFSLYKLARS